MPWVDDYTNTLLLNKELAEAYYLDGQLEKSQALIFHCLEKATNPIDRIRHLLCVDASLALESKYDEALDAAVNGLKELEYDFPKITPGRSPTESAADHSLFPGTSDTIII
jgi:hypothetical protein